MTNSVYQIQDNNNDPIESVGEVKSKEAQQIDSPKPKNNLMKDQISLNILPKPVASSKASTKTSSLGILSGAQPIVIPTATPETKNNNIDNMNNNENILMAPVKNKKVPKGVVPFPNREENKIQEKNIPDEVNLALPNRYRNNIIETEIQNEIKDTQIKTISQRLPEENQDKNNAQEVIDQPKINNNDLTDVKVEENEPKDRVVQHIENKRRKHIDSLAEKHEGLNKPPGQYEGEGDYDKDAHKEDLQIDENEQEMEGEEDGKR